MHIAVSRKESVQQEEQDDEEKGPLRREGWLLSPASTHAH